MNAYAVIMAGGSGTRLWPLSRAARPKQLLRLVDGKSLLRLSYERLATFLPSDRICVITGSDHLAQVADEVPELPSGNLFGEPVGRDTANAVGLAAAILHQRDPLAVMGVFTADHVITPVDRFAAAVLAAFETANAMPDALVTMGVTVREPETSFGYVKRGAAVSSGVYVAERFAEKPDAETAQAYFDDGGYLWNSGMFAWRTGAILEELKLNLPVTAAGVEEIARCWDTPDRDAMLSAVYPTLQKISIDYAVMERARRVLVVEMDCQWADVGSWSQLDNVLETDERDNVVAARRAVLRSSRGLTVVTEDDGHLIATLGVEDLVIVHAPDATLVCHKRDAPELKALLAQIESECGDRYA